MENPLIEWLQDWYASWCDEDWEHTYGVHIGTLDNPGWSVKIDLSGTDLEGKLFTDVEHEVSEDDWIHCRIRDTVFEGFGGTHNLEQVLQIFRAWAMANGKTV